MPQVSQSNYCGTPALSSGSLALTCLYTATNTTTHQRRYYKGQRCSCSWQLLLRLLALIMLLMLLTPLHLRLSTAVAAAGRVQELPVAATGTHSPGHGFEEVWRAVILLSSAKASEQRNFHKTTDSAPTPLLDERRMPGGSRPVAYIAPMAGRLDEQSSGGRAMLAAGGLVTLPMDDITSMAQMYGFPANDISSTASSTFNSDQQTSLVRGPQSGSSRDPVTSRSSITTGAATMTTTGAAATATISNDSQGEGLQVITDHGRSNQAFQEVTRPAAAPPPLSRLPPPLQSPASVRLTAPTSLAIDVAANPQPWIVLPRLLRAPAGVQDIAAAATALGGTSTSSPTSSGLFKGPVCPNQEPPETWGPPKRASSNTLLIIQHPAGDCRGGRDGDRGSGESHPVVLELSRVPGASATELNSGLLSTRSRCLHSSGCEGASGVVLEEHHLNEFLYDMDYVVPDDDEVNNVLFDPLYRTGMAPLECGVQGAGPLPGLCLAPHAPLLTQFMQPLYDDDYANDFGTAIQATPEPVYGPAGQLDALRAAVILSDHLTPGPWVVTPKLPAVLPRPLQPPSLGTTTNGDRGIAAPLLISATTADNNSLLADSSGLRVAGDNDKGDGSSSIVAGNGTSENGSGGKSGVRKNGDGDSEEEAEENLASRILFSGIPDLIQVPYPISVYAGTLYLAEADPILTAAGRAARGGLLVDYYLERNYYTAYKFTRLGPSAVATTAATARSRGQIGVAAKARAVGQALFNYRRSRYDDNRVEVFLNTRGLAATSVGAYLHNNPIVQNSFLLQGPNLESR